MTYAYSYVLEHNWMGLLITLNEQTSHPPSTVTPHCFLRYAGEDTNSSLRYPTMPSHSAALLSPKSSPSPPILAPTHPSAVGPFSSPPLLVPNSAPHRGLVHGPAALGLP